MLLLNLIKEKTNIWFFFILFSISLAEIGVLVFFLFVCLKWYQNGNDNFKNWDNTCSWNWKNFKQFSVPSIGDECQIACDSFKSLSWIILFSEYIHHLCRTEYWIPNTNDLSRVHKFRTICEWKIKYSIILFPFKC